MTMRDQTEWVELVEVGPTSWLAPTKMLLCQQQGEIMVE